MLSTHTCTCISHRLGTSCAKHISSEMNSCIKVTPVQLMRPGNEQNASCTVDDFAYCISSRPQIDPALRARALLSKINPTLEQCPHNNKIHMRWVGLQVQKLGYITHTAVRRTVQCTAKPGRVAADAAAEISAETAVLIAGSNKDLVLQQSVRVLALQTACAAEWTLPLFCSHPRIVPASWQALKLTLPMGRNRGNTVNV